MPEQSAASFTKPQPHAREASRLAALRELRLLDTAFEQRFDRITRLVSKVLDIETVLVSLVDENRQWFKSICNLEATQTPRDISFCGHAINEPGEVLVVPDAKADLRFRNNPLVVGAPKIRCYAGVVLRSPDGLPLGTLCTIGYEPREFSDQYMEQLTAFGEIVEYELYRSAWGLDKEPIAPAAMTADEMQVTVGNTIESAGEGLVGSKAEAKCDRGLKAISFDGVLAMRDQRTVIAVKVRLPRIDSLARAYGNTIVDELADEVERRLKLGVQSYPHHLERAERGSFKLLVGLPMDAGIDPLPRLRTLLIDNLGKSYQTKRVTISTPTGIGLSRPAQKACTSDSLLRCAEMACEHLTNLRTGPACKYYDANMGERAGRYRRISADVLRAIENDELGIVLQPKVRVPDGRLSGLEALIRWQHPEIGAVAPPEILQALDDLDRVPTFDLWVLRQVCKLMQGWLLRGFDPIPVSVNLCGTTLLDPQFPTLAREVAAEFNLPPDQIEFEILESVIVDDLEHASSQIALCRELGFSLALDDFGAGQTSLTYLSNLPINTVKVDRSFVANIVNDAQASSVLFQIIAMCKSLGKTTVVEGVETPGQYLLLRSFGCDSIQGFYFAKPMTPFLTEELLREGGAIISPRGLEDL